MSSATHVFVQSALGLADFVRYVEEIVGIRFTFASDEYDEWYEAMTPRVRVTIGRHEFDNDGILNFADYAYDISVKARRLLDFDGVDREKWQTTCGKRIFDQLKNARVGNTMLVDNLQHRLDMFMCDS